MLKKIMVFVAAIIVAGAINFAVPARAGGEAPSYQIVDLSRGWTDFWVQGINAVDNLIGNRRWTEKSGVTRTIAYRASVSYLLGGGNWGSMGYLPAPTGTTLTSLAMGINDRDVVVGSSNGKPVVWNPRISEVPGFEPGSRLNDINLNGLAVGRRVINGGFQGFQINLKNGTVLDLKGNISSDATAINKAGDFTGFEARVPGADTSSFFFGAANGYVSIGVGRGYDISERGTVVGHYGVPHAPFMKKNGEDPIQIAGNGYAEAVNARDEVVGRTSSGAFFYSQQRGLVMLSTVIAGGAGAWRLDRAIGINENGLIIGHGTLGGVNKSFLLIPNVRL